MGVGGGQQSRKIQEMAACRHEENSCPQNRGERSLKARLDVCAGSPVPQARPHSINFSWAVKAPGLVTDILVPCCGNKQGTFEIAFAAAADPKLVQPCSWHCRGSLCMCQPLPLPSPALPDGSSKLVPAEQNHKQIHGGPG